MPVDSTNCQYDDAKLVWNKMDDVLGGTKAVKAAGELYLPRLSNQGQVDYMAYKERAKWYGGTARAAQAMHGFLYRKDPKVTPDPKKQDSGNPKLYQFFEDATLTGKSWYDVMKLCSEKNINKGRYITVVDWDETGDRPFVRNYEPQDMINWQVRRVGEQMLATRIVFHEIDSTYIDVGGDAPQGDKYDEQYYDQWREYELLYDEEDLPFLKVTVWRRIKEKKKEVRGRTGRTGRLRYTGRPDQVNINKEEFRAVRTYFPNRRGIALSFIPAVPHAPDGVNWEVQRPPLEDMADLNISLYRTSADHKQTLHVLGCPTPWAIGFGEQGKGPDIFLGPSVVWRTNEPQAKVGFLELSGTGLANIVEDMKSEKEEMASLGARMIVPTDNAAGPEAFATVALRQSGEQSALMKIAIAQSQSLTLVLAIVYWWQGTAETVKECEKLAFVEVNTDFYGDKLPAADVQALTAAMISGGISYETLFHNLEQGEIIPPGVSLEQERERINNSQHLMLGAKVESAAAGAETATAGAISARKQAAQPANVNVRPKTPPRGQ